MSRPEFIGPAPWDFFLVVLAVPFPPLAVGLKMGFCSSYFWLNVLLVLFFHIPAVVHAIYVILNNPESHRLRARQGYRQLDDEESGHCHCRHHCSGSCGQFPQQQPQAPFGAPPAPKPQSQPEPAVNKHAQGSVNRAEAQPGSSTEPPQYEEIESRATGPIFDNKVQTA